MTDFEDWLRKRLGRSALFLKGNDGVPWRDQLLYACKHDLTYDRKCEESRATYLVELLEITGEPEFYRDRIIRYLTSGDEGLGLCQLFEIAATFATNGSMPAKTAMYTAFDRRGFAEAGVECAEQLVILDGLNAFLFVMKTFSQVEQDQRGRQFGHLLKVLRTHHGEQPVPQELRTFQSEWEEHETLWRPERQKAPPDYEEIKRRIVTKGRAGPAIFWSKHASDEDMKRLSRDLLLETDSDRLYGFLRMFQLRVFPGPLSQLIELSGHNDEEVARAAMGALSHFTSPDIRALAIKAAKNPKTYDLAVRMLVRNSAPGDYSLVEQFLEESVEAYPYHRLIMRVLDFVEAHRDAQAERSLILIYENSPCSLCRRHAVEELIAIQRTPEWMLEECRFDTDPKTRKLVASC